MHTGVFAKRGANHIGINTYKTPCEDKVCR